MMLVLHFLASALLKHWGSVLLWFRLVHKSCILSPSVHNTAHNWQGTIWSWSKPWEAEYSSNCSSFHRLSNVVGADWGLISSEVRPCNILVFSAFSPEICICSLHAYSAIAPVSGTVVMSTLVPINDYCCKEQCSIFFFMFWCMLTGNVSHQEMWTFMWYFSKAGVICRVRKRDRYSLQGLSWSLPCK